MLLIDSVELYVNRNACRHVCMQLVLKLTQFPTQQEEIDTHSLTIRVKAKLQNNKFAFNLFPPHLTVEVKIVDVCEDLGFLPSGALSSLFDLWMGNGSPESSRWAAMVYLWTFPACCPMHYLALASISPTLEPKERCC